MLRRRARPTHRAASRRAALASPRPELLLDARRVRPRDAWLYREHLFAVRSVGEVEEGQYEDLEEAEAIAPQVRDRERATARRGAPHAGEAACGSGRGLRFRV